MAKVIMIQEKDGLKGDLGDSQRRVAGERHKDSPITIGKQGEKRNGR